MPTFPIDGSIPSDQAMLLRLIDARFETINTKVDGVASSVDRLTTANAEVVARYDRRFEDHEHRLVEIESTMKARDLQVKDYEETKAFVGKIGDRVNVLEKWQTQEQTTTQNASRWGGFIWSVIGSGVTAVVIFVSTQFLGDKKQPTHSTQATELHRVESVTTNHR